MNRERHKSVNLTRTLHRKRFIWVGATFLVALVAVLIAVGIRSSPVQEPIVDGQPLSFWLARIDEPGIQTTAVDAVSKIGTNAIPWLLSQLEIETPAWKHRANHVLAGQRIIRFRFEEMAERHRIAVKGFRLLGPSAQTAIPELAQLRQRRPEDYYPLQALVYCGSEGLIFVWLSLTNGSSWIASVQAAALLRGGVETGRINVMDAMQFIPALMQLQAASNSAVSRRAALALKTIEEKVAAHSTNLLRRPLK